MMLGAGHLYQVFKVRGLFRIQLNIWWNIWWSFFPKVINFFRKNVPSKMINWVLNTPPQMICSELKIRSSHPEVFLGKIVLKISSKFTGEHPCRSVILIKLQSNFIETTLRHGFSPVNLQHIFRTPFPKKTSRGLLL